MPNSHKEKTISLLRRGYDLGSVKAQQTIDDSEKDSLENWSAGRPILLSGLFTDKLKDYAENIEHSDRLYQAVLESEQPCEELFDMSPYVERLEVNFESLGSSFNEGDDQEIETVLFDAVSDEDVIAEDLWMKASWLSFYEEDASLRFRFSYSALLAEAVFPESRIITANEGLMSNLCNLLHCERINFVERIVYFNAPQGGAYLHHDRERGHAGVVYAQLSGNTFWLALPREDLVKEVQNFVSLSEQSKWPETIDQSMQSELLVFAQNAERLTAELESFCNETLIHLINETAEFVQQLIKNGHSRQLEAGDVILLPQETEDSCCWHSVFNLV